MFVMCRHVQLIQLRKKTFKSAWTLVYNEMLHIKKPLAHKIA